MSTNRSRAARIIWWFFLLVLLGHTALVGTNIIRSAQYESWVNHTTQALSALGNLKGVLMDAERSTRGFVVTDEESFLVPLHEAPAKATQLHADIVRLTSDNAPQQKRLEVIEQTIQQRFKLLSELEAVGRLRPRDLEREKEMVIAGARCMDQFLEQHAALVSTEEQLLGERQSSAHAAIITSLIAAVMGGALTIGMLILVRHVIRQELLARRRGEEMHRQNEERFRAISESLPQIVWVARPDGVHEYCNKRWYNFTGLPVEKSVGYRWIDAVHPEDQALVRDTLQKAVAEVQPFELEYRLRHHVGIYRWHLDRAIPLRDKKGRVVRWFGTATDIDDRKRAGDELEERVRERTAELLNRTTELARSNQELEQFAYVASHDLQEPLRKIQAFGDRLKTAFGNQLGDQGQEYIYRMMSSASRMRRLIEDLLTFSRVTSRQRPHSEVDLNETVRDVLSDLEEVVTRLGAHVVVGPLPTVYAEPSQMRQVFQNLLANALKFHRPGVPPRVTVRAELLPNGPHDEVDQPTVRIEVIDNGIGFEEEYRERIFQVFQRLHPRGQYEGTGIGLAIVRKIVERHGGTVTATCLPGSGATFAVTLPTDNRQWEAGK